MQAAYALLETLEEMELLTGRVAKIDFDSRAEILRAADLMKRAAEGHGSFLSHLTALSGAIEELRGRQNASAQQLSELAEKLDARRKEYEALEGRFAELGEGAREVTDLLSAGVKPDAPDEATARIEAAVRWLTTAVEEVRTVGADAGEAGFGELEQQADAMRKQLSALLGKLDSVR